MKRIGVFCGSAVGSLPVYADTAAQFGTLLAERGLGLVYGGARVGLMGIIADAVLQAGGEAIGVIPSWLGDRELEHRSLTELHRVNTMHERKAKMADLADGFVALPGGCGTMDELFEIWTWAMLGLHAKPVGILNTGGYYDSLLRFSDDMVAGGFLRAPYRDMLIVEATAAPLLDAFASYAQPPRKWD